MKNTLWFFLRFLQIGLLSLLNQSAFAWSEVKVGQAPGAISGYERLDGSPVDLTKFKGKTLILYMGADWCPPCVSTGRPTVLAALERYKDKGVEVLYLNSDDNVLRSKKVLEEKQLGVQMAMRKLEECPPNKNFSCKKGSQGLLGEFGKVYTIPFALVIDTQGISRFKYERASDIADDLPRDLESLVTKK